VPTVDPLDVEALRAEVQRPDSLWHEVEVVAETGSTNADLAERFRRGEAVGGSVLVADHQSAGRGRQGRTWTAPPGTGIALSTLIIPQRVQETRWTWLPLIAGLAVADAIRGVAGVATALKWPNDVLVDERKICGVLAERVAGPDGAACVLGMGINVHLSAEELPVPTATSLRLLRPDLGRVRNELIASVLAVLELWIGRWQSDSSSDVLREAYVHRCATLGRQVEVHLGGGRVASGEAVGIDSDGRLVVATASGREVFGAGDVVHLR
jgi:BirA family transcriptional regulator, biotin operon repressor / biotin---[acetyl-CoA-carboxylase] ligase